MGLLASSLSSDEDLVLIRYVIMPIITSLIGLLFALCSWLLRQNVKKIESLGRHQIDFGTRLVKIETQIASELEYLKIFAIQQDTRITALEKVRTRSSV